MGDDIEREISDWAVDEAARHRRAERLARDFGVTAMEWASVLVAAAESHADVVMVLDDGRARRCRVMSVGDDVVEARTDGSVEMLVALDKICSVTVAGTPLLATGLDEPPIRRTRLIDLAARWAESRPRVTVTVGTTIRTGTLASVGLDVLSLATDNGEISYVRAGSVSVIASSES